MRLPVELLVADRRRGRQEEAARHDRADEGKAEKKEGVAGEVAAVARAGGGGIGGRGEGFRGECWHCCAADAGVNRVWGGERMRGGDGGVCRGGCTERGGLA